MTEANGDGPEDPRLRRLLVVGAVAATAVLTALHLLTVRRLGVDIPFWDEWEMFHPDALPAGLRWGWLVAQHNEHRIPLTKLQVWALHRLDGWDLVTHVTLNFALFAALVAAVGALVVRAAGPRGAAACLPFLPFLLSPLGYENHAWGFQSQFHLAYLGAVLAAWAVAAPRRGLREGLFVAAGVSLATAGMTGGLIVCGGLLAAAAAHEAWRLRRGDPDERRAARRFASAALLPAGGLALLWAATFTPIHRDHYLSPLSGRVLSYFGDLVALGFGITTPSVAAGAVCLVAALAPAALAVRGAPDPAARARAVATAGLMAGVLLALFAVAVGRAAQAPETAKSSKYWETAALLVPLTAVAWHQALSARPRARRGVLLALWVACAWAYADDWTTTGYQRERARRLEGLRCAASYYRDGAPTRCPEVYYGDLAPRLDAARALDASFTRRLRAGP
ncbi:MAG: hypothetical protein M9894_35120 [Planctomycetes bacterium]|nr:hypothetical protein [Planctomycetota bacterium]